MPEAQHSVDTHTIIHTCHPPHTYTLEHNYTHTHTYTSPNTCTDTITHPPTHQQLHTLGFCSTEKASYQPARRDRMLKRVTLLHLRRPCSRISVMCGERQIREAVEAFSSSDGSWNLVCSKQKFGEEGGEAGSNTEHELLQH